MVKECRKINDASYHRVKRLKETINYIIKRYDKSFFITLTFKDNVLNSTSEETRKRYVTRYLKQYNCYVANVDYGEKNGREHYHAVVGLRGDVDKINEYWEKKYGFVCVEPINVKQENNDVKLAKYVAKLSNHAIKETNKRKAVMYSRSL